MDYEKAYKDALERAKIFKEHLLEIDEKDYADEIEYIFPELKESEDEESEDERIRKEIKVILANTDFSQFALDYTFADMIVWLEKQGKTNETVDRDEFAQSVLRGAAINLITWIDYNAAEGNMCLSNTECKDIEDALVSGDWNKIYAYIKKKLEKKDGEKSAKDIIEAWKGMRLEVYAQASGNRHEPNYSDDTTKIFSLNDIDEIIEKISKQKSDNKVEQKPISDFNVVDWQPSKVDGKIHNIYHSRVEPKFHKFHESDWVVCEITGSVYQIRNCIESLSNHKYGYVLTNGGYIGSDEVNHYHLWTIADAKSGDVLTSSYGQPFIYNGYYDSFSVGAYGGLCSMGDDFMCSTTGKYWTTNIGMHPATKEQRDALFEKMKEAHYEWGNDKKELRKMEQQPKWTEEDEEIVSKLQSALDYVDFDYDTHKKLDNWLKSIEQRIGG